MAYDKNKLIEDIRNCRFELSPRNKIKTIAGSVKGYLVAPSDGVTEYTDGIIYGLIECIQELYSQLGASSTPAPLLPLLSGTYFDNTEKGVANSTLTLTHGMINLYPYFSKRNISINEFGIVVSSAVTSSYVRLLIYDSNSDGSPGLKLFESGNLLCDTTGYKYETMSFTFEKNKLYWLAIHSKLAPAVRAIPVAELWSLGLTGNTQTGYATCLRRTVAIGSAPTNWGQMLGSDRTMGVLAPSIRMKVS